MRQQGNISHRIAAIAATVFTAGIIAACAGNEPTAAARLAPRDASLSGVPVSRVGDGVAQLEFFEICKVYAEGSGPTVSVDWVVSGADKGAPNSSGTISLASGECHDVWNGDHANDTITVKETTVPAGYSASYTKSVIVRTGTAPGVPVTTNTGPFAGNEASGPVGGDIPEGAVPGTTITFTNTLITRPHLTVSKTVNTAFTRTYQWSVLKTNTDATPITVPIGQTIPLHYNIGVTNIGYTDGAWAVSGVITATNDGTVPATVNTVTDVSNFGAATVSNCSPALPATLAVGASLTCDYAQSATSGAAVSNTATASATDPRGGADLTFTGSQSGAFTTPTKEVDKCVTITDDKNLLYSQTVCATTTLAFTFTAGPWTAGQCGTVHVDNTASMTGDNGLLGTSTAGVDILVPCPPPAGCTYTIGYWKNHQSVTTPLLPITLGSGGGKSVVVSTWTGAYNILSMSGGASNGIVKLYAQMLGAKLSIKNGADGSAIAATIAAADAYLVGKNAADWAGLTKAQQQVVLGWMTTFDNYNNGLIGPIHCP